MGILTPTLENTAGIPKNILDGSPAPWDQTNTNTYTNEYINKYKYKYKNSPD